MKFVFICIVVAVTTLLQGCSDTVDGSSVAAYKKSVEKMTENMLPTAQRQLMQDMLLASETVQKMNVGTQVFATFNEEYLIEAMAKDLDGKSVADIQKMATKRREEIKKIAIERVEKEIALAEENLAAEAAINSELEKITFGAATVSVVIVPRHSDFQDRRPAEHWAYQVPVKNGSKFTVAGVKFRNEDDQIKHIGLSLFDEPLKPGEERDLIVYGLINEYIPTAARRAPSLKMQGIEFEMSPKGKPGEYRRDRSVSHLTQVLDNKKRELEKLQSGS